MKFWLCWGPASETDLSLENLVNLLFENKLYNFKLIEESSSLLNNKNKNKLPSKISFEYLLSEDQYEELNIMVNDKREEFMKLYSEKIYYLGIAMDYFDEFSNYNLSNITPFFENNIEYEFIVKIKKIANPVNYCERLVELEIIKDFSNRLKPKHIIWVSDRNKCIKKNELVSYNPTCFIDDGGSLNCGGSYKSLFVPIEKYRETFEENKFFNLLSEEELLIEKTHISKQINELEKNLHSLNSKLFKIESKLKDFK